MRKIHFIAAAALALPCAACATDVAVVGLFSNKAVVQINGGTARTLSIGQKTPEGVRLLAVERGAATLDIDGRRRTMKLGQQHASVGGAARAAVKVAADRRGHYVLDGQVNGGAVRFLLDTGATLVALSSTDARRLNIDYRKGPSGTVNTANGQATAWRVRLDTVQVGTISANNVDAMVVETPGMPALLGMSFLNRMDIRREGEIMTLTKRF